MQLAQAGRAGPERERMMIREVGDRMAAAGMTINGLCILHEEPDLLTSYTNEVIGGPGAFAEICPDYPAFAAAMHRKLARELNAPIV